MSLVFSDGFRGGLLPLHVEGLVPVFTLLCSYVAASEGEGRTENGFPVSPKLLKQQASVSSSFSVCER